MPALHFHQHCHQEVPKTGLRTWTGHLDAPSSVHLHSEPTCCQFAVLHVHCHASAQHLRRSMASLRRHLLAKGAASSAQLTVCRSCHPAPLRYPVHWPIPAVPLCAAGTKAVVPRLGCCSRIPLARLAALPKSMQHPVRHPRGSHFSMHQTIGLTCHPAPNPEDLLII